LSSGRYDAAISAGTNLGMLDFTVFYDVKLSGDGTVALLSNENIVSDGHNVKVTNSNDTLAGGGVLGDEHLTLVNSVHGIIDANDSNNGMVIHTPGHAVSNAGVIEASNGGWLVVDHTTVANSATGSVQALDSGTHLDLDGATISAGHLTVGAGAVVDTVNGSASAVTGAAVKNAGTIEAGYGDLTIHGAVTNTGVLAAANGSHLTVTGAVTGSGSATIESGGVLEFGAASSADVAFVDAGGKLVFDHATTTSSKFSGTISGFAHGSDIDLGAIGYTVGDAQMNYAENADHTGGVLTISDGKHTASLAFAGEYTLTDFHAVQDSSHHVDLLHV
jgi:hypothetical protein